MKSNNKIIPRIYQVNKYSHIVFNHKKRYPIRKDRRELKSPNIKLSIINTKANLTFRKTITSD